MTVDCCWWRKSKIKDIQRRRQSVNFKKSRTEWVRADVQRHRSNSAKSPSHELSLTLFNAIINEWLSADFTTAHHCGKWRSHVKISSEWRIFSVNERTLKWMIECEAECRDCACVRGRNRAQSTDFKKQKSEKRWNSVRFLCIQYDSTTLTPASNQCTNACGFKSRSYVSGQRCADSEQRNPATFTSSWERLSVDTENPFKCIVHSHFVVTPRQ